MKPSSLSLQLTVSHSYLYFHPPLHFLFSLSILVSNPLFVSHFTLHPLVLLFLFLYTSIPYLPFSLLISSLLNSLLSPFAESLALLQVLNDVEKHLDLLLVGH